MVKELNEKSQVDEKRVSEMNVNVENLNMNVSLQHRTVLGLVEDRKSILEKVMLCFEARTLIYFQVSFKAISVYHECSAFRQGADR